MCVCVAANVKYIDDQKLKYQRLKINVINACVCICMCACVRVCYPKIFNDFIEYTCVCVRVCVFVHLRGT